MEEKNQKWRRKLGTKDEFQFECTSCGECCRGDIRIRLNLLDLGRMATYLGFENTGLLFEEGWVAEESIDEGGFRPYISFKEKPFRFCPFLENRLEDDGTLLGLCNLHPRLKPLVCRLAPLGREVRLPAFEEWFFAEPIQGCPGCKQSTVCSLQNEISPLEDDLNMELKYFTVLEALQKGSFPNVSFRRFHRSYRLEDDLFEYLEKWLKIDNNK